MIIEALSKISHNIEWLHIGDGEELDSLKWIAKNKLPSNIKYSFSGYIENEKITDIYVKDGYHAFINVSETEGIPVSIMEALSCSVPIIATDVGGVSEMLHDNENGFCWTEILK